jgi:hypothetical protein
MDIWWKNIMQVDECWNEQNWGGKRERIVEVKVWNCGCRWWKKLRCMGDTCDTFCGGPVQCIYFGCGDYDKWSTEVGVWNWIGWIWTLFLWKWCMLSHLFLSLVPLSMLSSLSHLLIYYYCLLTLHC